MSEIFITSQLKTLRFFDDLDEGDSFYSDGYPFLSELIKEELEEGELDVSNFRLSDFELAIRTSIFAFFSTGRLIEEFIWKIGAEKETFLRYFYKNSWGYSVRSDLSSELYLILSEYYPGIQGLADLSVRFVPLRTDVVAGLGNLRLLKHLYESLGEFHENSCDKAARHGFVECLCYINENGQPVTYETAFQAAEGNSVDCLKYLVSVNNDLILEIETIERAAEHGSFEAFQYLHSLDNKYLEEVVNSALKGGHLHILDYCLNNDHPVDDDSDEVYGRVFLSLSYNIAAENGFISVIRYLMKKNRPRNDFDTPCASAAKYSHYMTAEFCISQGFALTQFVCEMAVYHYPILKLVREHGCPWYSVGYVFCCLSDINSTEYLIDNHFPDILDVYGAAFDQVVRGRPQYQKYVDLFVRKGFTEEDLEGFDEEFDEEL